MPSALPCWMWLSMSAASRLVATPIAAKSPVKCRLMSSIGTIWAYPPPAAPPFMPKTGPSAGSRRHTIARSPILESASPRPTVVVVFPSPAGVGETAVTSTSLPRGRSAIESRNRSETFALWRPYGSRLSSGMPSPAATSVMGSIRAAWAISMLLSPTGPPRVVVDKRQPTGGDAERPGTRPRTAVATRGARGKAARGSGRVRTGRAALPCRTARRDGMPRPPPSSAAGRTEAGPAGRRCPSAHRGELRRSRPSSP